MDGWVRDFTSLSTVFQSYRDDGRANMKGSVQWSAVYVREESLLKRDSNPRPVIRSWDRSEAKSEAYYITIIQ